MDELFEISKSQGSSIDYLGFQEEMQREICCTLGVNEKVLGDDLVKGSMSLALAANNEIIKRQWEEMRLCYLDLLKVLDFVCMRKIVRHQIVKDWRGDDE